MEFDNLLKRANFSSIAGYMYSGDEYIGEILDKSYAERIKEADKAIDTLFEEHFSDSKELDEFLAKYIEQISVYMNVYFEMGILAGGKLALDIEKKYRLLVGE